MLKMMVVDDETMFREYLCTTINWGAYGFEICGQAKNGHEALEQAQKNMPDIALIDINMPYMDGLTLSEKLKEKQPEIGIVLITGHSEFEYARKAVRIGVDDYILKPFEKEELVLTLLKLKKNIQKVQQEKFTAQNDRMMMRKRLLNELIGSERYYNDQELKNKFKAFEVMLYSCIFQVSCIEIDHMDQKWEEISERALWKYAVSNILNEIAEVQGNHFVFNGPEGRIVSMIEFKDHRSRDEFSTEAYEKLCNLIQDHLAFTITVGVGKAHQGFDGIRDSYMESLAALQNKFILGNNKVIEYAKLGKECSNIGFYPNVINEDLLINLRLNDWPKIERTLNEVFGYIRGQRLSIEYTYVICMGLISLCLSYVTESGNSIENIFGEDFLPFSEVRNKESIDAAYDWIVQLFRKTVEPSRQKKMTRTRKIAEAVKEYIDTHYHEQVLSIEHIALNIYMNPGYLRTTFKKEMGLTVGKYIASVRMQKARELLNTGNMKLAEIAEKVGFSDAGYFSKCFKKYFGISPSEYETIRK
ncbi:MAG: response regulator [Firmicutes bacterium]|nr:response regulator [Bacillota bacterium]